jgi:hypothetical protein
MQRKFTTRGSVRGGCGHEHRAVETAAQCAAADDRWCKRQGGYSDRRLVVIEGESPTDEELDVFNGLRSGEVRRG